MPKLEGMKVFSGSGNLAFSREVAKCLGIELGKLKTRRFVDGEIYVKFEESVRGVDAFLIQPTCHPVDTNLVELLILIDALRRASADRITIVVPYYGYARQEKKDAPREPITAKLVADILTTAGADRLVTMDLHADAIQGFFNIPVDHLTALGTFCNYFESKKLKDIVVISPDEGRVKNVRKVVTRLDAPLAVCYKHHPGHHVSEISHLAGDVRGKTPIIIEDIISTGGSIIECVDTLLRHGCKPEIYVGATHGVLAGDAFKKLDRPEIKEVVVTNTIPLPKKKIGDKFKVLTVAPLFAEAIRRIHGNESVSSLFD